MTRQSISFSPQNDAWLNAQVMNGEYGSKSELVNELIRQARAHQLEIEVIRAALKKGEESGISTLTKREMLAEFKERWRAHGTV